MLDNPAHLSEDINCISAYPALDDFQGVLPAGSDARILSHAVFVPKVEPAPDGSLRFAGAQAQGA